MRTPAWHFAQKCMTFEMWIGASRSTTPPGCVAERWRVWRFTNFTRSTLTRFSSRNTFKRRPDLPRSSPAMTITWSFLRNVPISGPLNHFRSEGDDLHELALAKLAGHGSEDAGSLRLLLVVDQDGRVLVEPD